MTKYQPFSACLFFTFLKKQQQRNILSSLLVDSSCSKSSKNSNHLLIENFSQVTYLDTDTPHHQEVIRETKRDTAAEGSYTAVRHPVLGDWDQLVSLLVRRRREYLENLRGLGSNDFAEASRIRGMITTKSQREPKTENLTRTHSVVPGAGGSGVPLLRRNHVSPPLESTRQGVNMLSKYVTGHKRGEGGQGDRTLVRRRPVSVAPGDFGGTLVSLMGERGYR